MIAFLTSDLNISIIDSLVTKKMSTKGSFLSKFKEKSQLLVDAVENRLDLEYDLLNTGFIL